MYAPLLATMETMKRIVKQQRGDKNKVYSLHAPETSCIAKGKEHKKYEFGSKVSVAALPGSHVIVGMSSFAGNPHDSKTLAGVLDEVAQSTGRRYARVLDKGYRGHGKEGNSEVIIPGKKSHASAYARRRHKTLCKRRSAIEALISHLKRGHRMGRNYLKGSIGDANNALLAGMGFNIMLLIRDIAKDFFSRVFSMISRTFFSQKLLLDTNMQCSEANC